MQVPSIIEKLLRETISSSLKIISGKSLGGGCINHAMKICTSEGDFFAKFNHEGPSDLFLREAECLEELAKAGSSLLIPKVLAKTSLNGNGIPAILITEYLAPSTLSSIDYDERLGRGLAELHKYRSDKFGFYHDNYCGSTIQDNEWNMDWIDFFGRQRLWRLVKMIQKKRGLVNQEINVYEGLIEKLPEIIFHDPAPALIHGDLWSGNYLATADGPAIIDPASYYADRECEFSIMNMFGGFSQRIFDAYHEVYPLDDDWKDRNDLYMIYHYLNHHYLFGGAYGSQALMLAKKYI
jgi:protein-ribulosamine 3-kinase